MLRKDRTAMAYDSFETVSHLETAFQRALLQNGDSVERVWAAWALGLKFGSQIIPDLQMSLQANPSSGTRRQFVVILAGLGDPFTVEDLARYDPDEFVRATACQYLLKTAQTRESRLGRFLLERLSLDASALVRLAILENRRKDLPPIRSQHLRALEHDPDPHVRGAAALIKGSESAGFSGNIGTNSM
jgi:HEAT repeat protein